MKHILPLVAGMALLISVHAQQPNNTPSPEITSKPFLVYFGYGVNPNKMTPVAQYFCYSENNGSFTIKKRNESGMWNFKDATPVIYYTWVPQNTYHFLPKKRRSKTFGGKLKNFCGTIVSNKVYRIGFAGGLGLNLLRPQFMAAPAFIIGKNLSFQAGVCVVQKYTLRGEYAEGMIVNEHLDFENLHQRVYYPEWFFSVAFRFDKVVFVEHPEE